MTDTKLKRVLILDDEPNIVNAVQRELNSPPFVNYLYQTEGYTDPLRALERAQAQTFDAVISDYRMPGMNGLDFLKALAGLQPDCARLVLSGQTDRDALVRMVNTTHIYRFIPKPWQDYLLKTSLSQALDYNMTLIEHRRLATLIRKSEIFAMTVPEREIDPILIVDDDPAVLSSLSRVLTQHSPVDDLFVAIRSEVDAATAAVLHEDLIKVQMAPSPHHALQMAEGAEFSCIIADYAMPEMNGVELLKRFYSLQPDCARILISGGIGKDELIAAVDAAHIFAFINKPWTDFDLKAQIALALSRRRMLRENRQLAEMVSKGARRAVN